MAEHFLSGIRDEHLAIASSLFYAGTLVSIRWGMMGGTPFAALLTVNSIVALGGLGAAAARGTLFTTTLIPLMWFALVGFFAQGIGTLAHFTGIERMGVSRSTSIQSSSPLWGAIFAVLALGERPGPVVIACTLAIVAGVVLLAVPEKRGGEEGWFQGALIFPLISSVAYAFVPVFTKFAYAYQQTPLLGFGVAFAAGTLTMLAGRRILPGGGEIRATPGSLAIFAGAGVLNLAGAVLFWSALVGGDVSILLPISRLYPLWVLILSAVFLGGLEKITPRVALAGAMIFSGGAVITAIQ
jgi:drug/metabolite transporter (DMT)-like permease